MNDKAGDPVMDALYAVINQIKKSTAGEIAAGRTYNFMDLVLKNTQKNLGWKDPTEEEESRLLIGLLHYTLTARMIPSQRKVEFDSVEVDIVIPDLRRLRKAPDRALLICVPGLRHASLELQVRSMESIQPVPENIWYVTNMQVGARRYSEEDGTICGMIQDIEEFLVSAGRSPLRILAADQ